MRRGTGGQLVRVSRKAARARGATGTQSRTQEGDSVSENLTKLREAMHWERGAREQHVIAGAPTYPRPCPACAEGTSFTDAALAAVEQELAALRLSYENASRAHYEATKRIDALTECQAKLKAELDEEVDHNARLSAKLDETKHNCACDYDERGAVCLVHARPVREARERIAALEAERDKLRKELDDLSADYGVLLKKSDEHEAELRKRRTFEDVWAVLDPSDLP
ncbi:MAG TPA: hypothetical protein VF102_04415, partial [Gemmatimonadaceae bacterium]